MRRVLQLRTMRHARPLGALALAVLLVTAGCSGALGAGAQSDRTTGGQTIGVSASGQVEASPDQAIVRVAVVATGDDASAARQRLARNVSQMRGSLEDVGVTDDQVTTHYYDIDRERRERPPEKGSEDAEPTYRAVHAFEVTLSDVEKVGTVIDTAVENGATEIDGVEFTLSRERRSQLRSEALADAMGNARSKASVLATESNLSITGVQTAQTADVAVASRRETVAMAAAGDGGATSVESGPVTVTARVVVTYNATG